MRSTRSSSSRISCGSRPAAATATLIAPARRTPNVRTSARDTMRVWVYDDEDGLVSMRWDGTDRKAHLIVTGFQQPRRRA